ncbi:hypothetical protein H4R24_005284 [Coemansia sp. RSA 988]|nr:hypothetical protein H4R24_005284 [Coemansia sp. RSA 988]
MAKRGGELGLEWDSPERKRLRNTKPASLTWMQSLVSEDQRCANDIVSLLEHSQHCSLTRRMDTAVQLVQKLRHLQSMGTDNSCRFFEQSYGCVLDYVGNLVHALQQNDEGSTTYQDDDAESVQKSFADVYQFLVEIIARHTEYLQGKDGYLEIVEKPHITVDDPPLLLKVVANAVGFVCCARAGCLSIGTDNVLGISNSDNSYSEEDGMESDSASDSIFQLVRDAIDDSDLAGGHIDIWAICRIYSCCVCDARGSTNLNLDITSATGREAAIKPLKTVTLSSWLPYWFIASSRQHESTATQFVRNAMRFVVHAPVQDIGLKVSPLGQGIIRRLSSSSREMRLAARDAILSYSQGRATDPEDVKSAKHANRTETMRLLERFSRDKIAPDIVDETYLLVAGGVGRAAALDEAAMSAVVPFIVEYYMESNVFLRAVAMEQLLLVSQEHRMPLSRLLSYFAESLACTLTLKLTLPPPAPFMQCMQMLAMTPDGFMRKYQDRIVPELFIGRSETALPSVANILEIRLPVLCVNHAASIFARIFLVEDQLMQVAMDRFIDLLSTGSELDKDQVEVNIPSLLRSCSVKLIFNLVLALGQGDSTLRRRARSAIATVQNVLDNAALGESQGVATIVQQSAENMKTISKGESPRSGKQYDSQSANSDLACFLSRHMLGILAYMNELLRDAGTQQMHNMAAKVAACQSESARRTAIYAIGEMIILLGGQAASHTINLVASLTPPLTGPLASTALEAWTTLVESLEHVQLSADQINALLVPLLTAFVVADTKSRVSVAAVIDRVVELHSPSIKQHQARICPIPDDPLLAKCHSAVQELASGLSLRQRLSELMELLETKDSTIVLCASREICKLLLKHSKQILTWKQALTSQTTDAYSVSRSLRPTEHGGIEATQTDALFISNIIATLKSACCVGGPLSELASANCTSCLALIGAVDNSALDSHSTQVHGSCEQYSRKSTTPTLRELNDEDERVEFVCTLIIDYLVRAFAMAPSPGAQMSVAYTIQELLRLVGFTMELLNRTQDMQTDVSLATPRVARQNTKATGSRNRLLQQRWELLPENVVMTIRPLLDSKYTIHHSNRGVVDKDAGRVACIAHTTSHASWLRAWAVELANALPETPAGSLLRACTSAIKESPIDLVSFMLPQIVYQYCMGESNATKKEESELIVVKDDDDDVLMDGGDAIAAQATKVTNSAIRNIVVSEILAVLSSSTDDCQMEVDDQRRCKATMLELLDACSSHLRARQDARTANKRSSRRDSKISNATREEKALLDITTSIPMRLIAQSAQACGQYERAIMYAELALREGAAGKCNTLFGNVDDDGMAEIQELYFGMDDVDGVSGAALCRRRTDPQLTIRRYEIEGNWSHALIGRESLLRQNPESKESQIGWIECLQNMGQWEGAWTASRSLYTCAPQIEADKQLNSACFAAAWRLGKWDWAEEAGRDAISLDGLGPTLKKPGFDAINSLLLRRLGRGSEGELRGLALPLAFNGQTKSTGEGYLDMQLAALMEVAFGVVGCELARVPAAVQHSATRLFATTSAKCMAHEIHAHMLGDVSMLGRHLEDVAPIGRAQPVDMHEGGAEHDCSALCGALNGLVEKWRGRIANLPATYTVQEPVLALHTRLYDIMLEKIGRAADGSQCACASIVTRQSVRTRLQAAQLARAAGSRATAMGILTYAEVACARAAPAVLAAVQTEQAQILWDEGHVADAISAISRVVSGLSERLDIANSGDSDTASESGLSLGTGDGGLQQIHSDMHQIHNGVGDVGNVKAAFADAALLQSQWQETASSVSSVALLGQYEKILRVQESDRVHYAFGRLYDKLFTTMTEKDAVARSSKTQQTHRRLQMATLQYYVVRHYSRAVIYGSRFLYRALPRLLTVWLDFGANVLGAAEARMVERFKTANRVVSNLAKRLPAYGFLVVFSQLVSRICHANEDVFAVLEGIVLRVLDQFPQQALWQLMGVQRSTYAARAERSSAVLAKARAAQQAEPAAQGRGRGMGELIQQATRLTDLLLALCNAPPPARTTTTMHMARDFKALARAAPLDLVVPLQRCLVPALPDTAGSATQTLALDAAPGSSSTTQTASQRAMLHQPFAAALPTISAFADEIVVMHSLQRPKKITVVGSDGRLYGFLCKPKDDLRKDARLMEFNSMINQLLDADAHTRRRGLRIRTYAVVPLNEECGLIEWVGPTTGIRHILLRLYKQHGVAISTTSVKAILDADGAAPEDRFVRELLPLFPPVLHAWFRQAFPDPPRWLASRTAFARSAAVMSMVGHVLGLGDRHCENILLDESSGAVVHVDFNCLFDKGMTLEKPEKVPFRLTHNMVDAMGATGYEGAFRCACELTLRLLRDHRDALMSVLESFLHDPLVEWSRRATRSASRAAKDLPSAQPNEQASRCLASISRKLQGVIQGMSPLSVEGQVDELITEATDPKRLFSMYIGWAAYM